MRISKLACLSPPPFAPDEIEPDIFILRQVFDRERILAGAGSVITAFMLAIIIIGISIQLIGSVWPNTTVPMLNLMISV